MRGTVVAALARFGIVEESRADRIFDLAWPRIVTGFSRMSKETLDFAMIGVALGPQALAGTAFAIAYFSIGNMLSLGLAGGTISVVSRAVGKGDHRRAGELLTQSVLVALGISLTLAFAYRAFATDLLSFLGSDATALGYGSAYLRTVSLALPFAFLNSVSSRTFAAVDDTRTPMFVRIAGAAVNLVVNVVLVFWLGWGVTGAAVGTLVSTALATSVFAWGFLGKRYPHRDALPVRLQRIGPGFRFESLRELLAVSTPLVCRNLAKSLVVFPLLSLAATYGAVAVAAFEASRRVRKVINCPAWGLSLASSSFVGQCLGRGDRVEARYYGRAILRLSLFAYLLLAAVTVVFARPIAGAFVDHPSAVELTTAFVRVAAISAVGMGVDGAATGALRGVGDTTWPFYGTLLGSYGMALPVAYLGHVWSLGVVALLLALVAETAAPAVVSLYRYRAKPWTS